MSKLFKARKARTAGLITIAAITVAGLGAIPASALSNGNDVPNNENPNVVKVATGYGTCTGALIDPSWVVTVTSCFSQNPANFAQVKAGKPALPAKVLFGTEAASRDNIGTAVETIKPYDGADGRDLVLVKLSTPAFNTTPFKVSNVAPTVNEKFDFIGWGRTKTEWVPAVSHKASFNTTALNATTITVAGSNPVDASLCLGDSGAPAIRTTANGQEIVALNSRSWQKNCIGSTQTQDGAFASRLDDVNPWITDTITNGNKLPSVSTGSIVKITNAGIATSCLGIARYSGYAKQENLQVQSIKCANGPLQQWEVNEVAPAVYQLKNDYGKLCLSISGDSTAELANVTQRACDAQSKFQQWKSIPVGGGKFNFVNSATGFVAGAGGVTTGTDEKIVQQQRADQAKQQWSVSVVGEAKYDIAQLNSFISVQAAGPGASKGLSVRHINGQGQLAAVTSASALSLRQDASWKIVPGLADPKCYSFQSVNFPDKYLTADSSTAKVTLAVPSWNGFSTWCARTAIDGTSLRLQWWADTYRNLRHNAGLLYAGTPGAGVPGADDVNLYNESTAWTVNAPWATPAP